MNKHLFTLLIFLIMTKFSLAEFVYLGDIASSKSYDDRIEFILSNSKFNLYFVADNIVRFRFTNRDEFSKAPSYAVIYKPSKVVYNLKTFDDHYEITTKELKINITKSPCRLSIYDIKGNLLNEDDKSFGVSYDNDEVRVFKKLFNDEQFYGLGEKTGNLNKRGEQWTMWNSDVPGYARDADPIYQSIPFFIGIRDISFAGHSKSAYGIFLDNTYKSYFNLGASNNRFYWFGAEKGELDYYFIYGPDVKKVISSYTMLTGRMEMPPLWSLGYQQSKWSYYPESEVRTIASQFRNRQIPCDVIYLDIHYMNGYRVFTWNKDRFPNPQKMLSDLSNQGFKVITIVDPGVKADTNNYPPAKEGLAKNLFAKYPDGQVYQGQVWPSWAYFPDFTKQETRDWWGEKNADWLKQGLAGIWNDMNEPAVWGRWFPDIVRFDDNGFKANHKKIHNVYGLEMAHATFKGIKKEFPNKRPFILTRAGFSGIQRYSAVWTGDNVASEEHLKLACTMVQGMGLSGIAFAGSDVGGFMGEPSARLFTRWLELGALTPFFRAHSHINLKSKEPWTYGEAAEQLNKNIIEFRYRLLPFLYNEFYTASTTGLPIMRSMVLNYQDDPECYTTAAQYQFMIGDNLLAAPVLSETEDTRKLYLPEGEWLDWWTHKVYKGKQWILVEAPIGQIPLFIKDGGIIPMQEVENFVGEKKISQLELNIFPGKNGEYTLYQDDGISQDYNLKEIYSLTKFVLTSGNQIQLKISKDYDHYDSGIKSYLAHFNNVNSVSSVEVNGEALKKFASLDELNQAAQGYFIDNENKILSVKFNNSDKVELVCSK